MYVIRRGKVNILVEERDGKCHKKPFNSPAKARKFLKKISGKNRAKPVVRNVYKCRMCPYWHLTKKDI